GSNDFDRGARQQRVLISLRQQSDPAALVSRLDELIGALKSAVHTDIPVGLLPQLLDLASGVDTHNIRSYVFAPPFYGSEPTGDPRGYVLVPRIDRIRAAVANAFTANPADEALREALSEEGARLWVLNGSGQTGQASRVAAFLDDRGIEASSPNQLPDARGLRTTKIVVYNGAEAKIPNTLAYLKQVFGVTPTTASDPTVLVDVIVTTGRSTPDLTPPPAP
ncbi:MAG TPA: LCP family protein, partial [Candidatus Limnocylindrales bacterium]|nr:LCP family protein [Candidatus Limnocylindrales bacterium]